MQEVWKDIKGYEGLYQVSTEGRVKSFKKKDAIILKPVVIGHKPNNLYYAVNLHKDGSQKQVSIHSLVAKTFIDNPLNLPLINHKDEVTFNNVIDNLEWCTHQYNQEYSLSKKIYKVISPDGVLFEVKNMRKFARENKLNHAHMYQICKGTLRSHKGWYATH